LAYPLGFFVVVCQGIERQPEHHDARLGRAAGTDRPVARRKVVKARVPAPPITVIRRPSGPGRPGGAYRSAIRLVLLA
jgi:hypothetical protein